MRAYFFTNMYLSQIQKGIQSGHVISQMSTQLENYYFEWANNHKTMIVLNGGNSNRLLDIIEYFDSDDNPYVWDYFRESDEALDGALTCVGIILPEIIYNNASALRNNDIIDLDDISDWERELYVILNNSKLA